LLVVIPAQFALGLARFSLGLDQLRQGTQYSQGIGSGVYSPSQEAEAPGLHSRGWLNIVSGILEFGTSAFGFGQLTQAPSTTVRVIETPAGLMATDIRYPGFALWIEGNAAEVTNEAGDVIANGFVAYGKIWLRPVVA